MYSPKYSKALLFSRQRRIFCRQIVDLFSFVELMGPINAPGEQAKILMNGSAYLSGVHYMLDKIIAQNFFFLEISNKRRGEKEVTMAR